MGTIRKLGEGLVLLIIFSLVLLLFSRNAVGDDDFEENDDMAHAFPLEPGVYADLNASDPDCYLVDINFSGILRITVWYQASLGSVDLLLFSDNGTELLTSGTGEGGERVEIIVSQGERYFFEVRNGTLTEYHMAIVNGNQDSWTFGVYMDGDNSLHDNMEPDLVEMRRAGSGGGLHIPILKDGEQSKDTVVVYVMNGYDVILPIYVVDQSWDQEVNMGDPQTLAKWLEWCTSTFDTGGNIALDLWDHGNGVWGACWDSNSGNDLLTLADIREALVEAGAESEGKSGVGSEGRSGAESEGRSETGPENGSGVGKIELLGSDSCLMQVLELSHEVKGLANYFIASQEDEPKDGWDYEPFLKELSGNLSWNGEELGRSIIKGYIAEYGEDGDETLSVIDLSAVPHLVSSITNLSDEVRENMEVWADEIRAAREDTREFNYYYVDILDFTRNLKQRTDNDTILGLIEDVISNFEETILHEEHGAKRYNSNGLSMYFPKSDYDSDYDDITFRIDTGWGDFLQEWIPVTGGPIDHFDRVLFYPRDDDLYPGNDTMLVKFKPFTDQASEEVMVTIDIIDDENEHIITSEILYFTIHQQDANFIDHIIHLGENGTAGNHTLRIGLYDSQGNRDDMWTSDPFWLHPYNIAPPPPTPPKVSINPESGRPFLVHADGILELKVTVYAGIPTTFQWDLNGDGSANVNTSSNSVSIMFQVPGNHVVSLLVTDDWNQTAEDSVTVEVNAYPLISSDSNDHFSGPGKVNIPISTSDPDGDITFYEWDRNGDGDFEEASVSAFPSNFHFDSSGHYNITFKVTDSKGASAQTTVHVEINAPPIITSLEYLEVMQEFDPSALVTFQADAIDPDGKIVCYSWDLDGDGENDRETELNSTQIVLVPGKHTISLTVRDDHDQTASRSLSFFIERIPEIIISTSEPIQITSHTFTHYGNSPMEIILSVNGYLDETAGTGEFLVTMDDVVLYSRNVTCSGMINLSSTLELTGSTGSHVLRITLSNGTLLASRELTIQFDRQIESENKDSPSENINNHIFYPLVILLTAMGSMVILFLRKRG